MATEPKRRGRPPKGKRGTFTFRVTEGLRDRLEQAAEVSGRSVSEEIELRLEQSFQTKELIAEASASTVATLINDPSFLERVSKMAVISSPDKPTEEESK